jgi:hypothetical protein
VAKLWITDNNYYVRRGYPFTGPDGAEDCFVRTYHVSPRGSSLIENLGWRDGKEFPKSIFYALVVDGDLFFAVKISKMQPSWQDLGAWLRLTKHIDKIY